MIDVSIVIVNYNNTDQLRDCVASVRALTKQVSYEIIVSDNGSSLPLDLPKAENISVVYNHTNLGFGRANNAAAKLAKGEFVFFLNPDTILLNDAVSTLVFFLREHPEVGAAGGNLFASDYSPTHSFHRLPPSILRETDYACGRMWSRAAYGENAEFNHTSEALEVKCITGADLLVRRSLFERINGFDDRFFMYYEDADLCARVRQAGYSLFSVPEAQIIHLEGGSFATSEKRERLILEGRNTYFRLHYSRLYCLLADACSLLSLCMAVVVYGLFAPKKARKYLYRIKHLLKP